MQAYPTIRMLSTDARAPSNCLLGSAGFWEIDLFFHHKEKQLRAAEQGVTHLPPAQRLENPGWLEKILLADPLPMGFPDGTGPAPGSNRVSKKTNSKRAQKTANYAKKKLTTNCPGRPNSDLYFWPISAPLKAKNTFRSSCH